MKILMVCLGNICRSPLAEGILQQKSKEAGLDWFVDSAGTGGYHTGQAPDSRSVAIAAKNGLDISAQRARTFTSSDFAEFDRIYAMDSSNYRDIVKLAGSEEEKARVKMIMNASQPGKNVNVPDPYYDSDGFAIVFNMLSEACEQIVKELS